VTRSIAEYLRKTGDAGSREIVEEALGLRGADDALCEKLVCTALANDARFRQQPDGTWAFVPNAGDTALDDAVFAVVHAVCAEPGAGVHDLAAVFARQVRRGKPLRELRVASKAAAAQARDLTEGGPVVSVLAPREVMRRVAQFVQVFPFVSFGASGAVTRLQRASAVFGITVENEPVCLSRLARVLLGQSVDVTPEGLAARLGLVHPQSPASPEMLDLSADVFAHLLTLAEGRQIETVQQLMDVQYPTLDQVEFSRYAFDREFVQALPDGPGVYHMRDAEDRILYVGKAKSLRARVGSYFRPTAGGDEKGGLLLSRLHSLDYTTTGSELEALVLEAETIQRLDPPVNVQFEVHERPTPYVSRRRLVIVMPSLQAGAVELLALHEATALLQVRHRARDLEKASSRLERFFSKPAAATAGAIVAGSWLERNRDVAHFVDIDEAGGLSKAMVALKKHAQDVLRGDVRASYI